MGSPLLLLSKNKSGIPRRGLVARWRLGNGDSRNYIDSQTVADLSGNGNTLQRGSTSGTDTNDFTIETWDASFDGVDDYGIGPLLALSNGATYIAVYSFSGSTAGNIIAAAQTSLAFQVNSTGRLYLESCNFAAIATAGAVHKNVVICGAVSYFSNTGAYAFYYSGTLDSSGTNIQPIQNNQTYQVGRQTVSSPKPFTGNIYELLVYNSVLSPVEINQAYRSLKSDYARNGSGINL